jgi:hypothetical protein
MKINNDRKTKTFRRLGDTEKILNGDYYSYSDGKLMMMGVKMEHEQYFPINFKANNQSFWRCET